jgi:hypothetical protein
MSLRRRVAALAAATAVCALGAPTATAATAAGTPADASRASAVSAVSAGSAAASAGSRLPSGLYGKADPKFDGVWRQSIALLALKAAGATPAAKAVQWLAEQQCADGSFTAYRADPGTACDAKKTPGDTNATAVAVQALDAVGGQGAEIRKSLAWLRSVQNKDGGWGYNPGGPTDTNSTSVVIGAYAAAGEQPGEIRKGEKSPYDALTELQLGCDTKAVGRGAFAYQPDKKGELAANDDATAAAALAGLGSGLLARTHAKSGPQRPVEQLDCGKDGEDSESSETGKDTEGGKGRGAGEAADAGAAYLASVLKKNGGYLKGVTPGAKGGPDYANTADAVIALAAGGHRAEAKKSLEWLAGELDSWDKSRNDPAAIGGVMLAVHATGGDAAELKGTKLLERLNATGPKPARMPGSPAEDGKKKSAGSSVLKWSLIGAGVAAGAGVGFLISMRRKRTEP